MKTFSFAAIISALVLASCAPQYGPAGNYRNVPGYNGIAGTGITKSQVGTVAGALGGAFAAKDVGKGKGNTLAIAGGALLGGLLGNELGASLDRADQSYLSNTFQKSLEQTGTGVTSNWTNPDSGNAGSITPTRTFQNPSKEYCREFTQNINVGGQNQKAFGTACRQPDGSWKVISN